MIHHCERPGRETNRIPSLRFFSLHSFNHIPRSICVNEKPMDMNTRHHPVLLNWSSFLCSLFILLVSSDPNVGGRMINANWIQLPLNYMWHLYFCLLSFSGLMLFDGVFFSSVPSIHLKVLNFSFVLMSYECLISFQFIYRERLLTSSTVNVPTLHQFPNDYDNYSFSLYSWDRINQTDLLIILTRLISNCSHYQRIRREFLIKTWIETIIQFESFIPPEYNVGQWKTFLN